MNRVLFILYFSYFLKSFSYAGVCTFLPSNGSWGVATNWDCNYVPTVTDTVVINDNTTAIISGPNPINGNNIWFCHSLVMNDGRIETVTGSNNASLHVQHDATFNGGQLALGTTIFGNAIFSASTPILYLMGGFNFNFYGASQQYSNISFQNSSVLVNYGTYNIYTTVLGISGNNGKIRNYGNLHKWNTLPLQFNVPLENETTGVFTIHEGTVKTSVGISINKYKFIIDENAILEVNNSGLQLYINSIVEGLGKFIINNSFSGGGGSGTTLIKTNTTINGSCSINNNTLEFTDSVKWISGSLLGSGTYMFSNTSNVKVEGNVILGTNANINAYGSFHFKTGSFTSIGNQTFNNYTTTIVDGGFSFIGNSQSMFNNYSKLIINNGVVPWGMRLTNHVNGIIGGNGRINFTNQFTPNGWINPGSSAGSLVIDMMTTTTLQLDKMLVEIYNNSGGGTGHDSLTIQDNIALSGTLQINEMGCTQMDTFVILKCLNGSNCLTGTFDNVILPPNYNITYSGNQISIGKTNISCQTMVCNTNDNGDGSLRVAVDCASNNQTILFDNALIGDTILLTTDDIHINKDLVLDASTINGITIDASNINTAFSNAIGKTFELNKINILAGNQVNGSAIFNEGVLNLRHTKLYQNPTVSNDIPMYNLGVINCIENSELK